MVAGCPCGGGSASDEDVVEVRLRYNGGCDVNIEGPIYTREGCVNVVYAVIFSIGEKCVMWVGINSECPEGSRQAEVSIWV